MMTVGIALLIFGYNLLYVGTINLLNGGQGPGLWEALGIINKVNIEGVGGQIGSAAANLTGQVAQPAQTPTGATPI